MNLNSDKARISRENVKGSEVKRKRKNFFVQKKTRRTKALEWNGHFSINIQCNLCGWIQFPCHFNVQPYTVEPKGIREFVSVRTQLYLIASAIRFVLKSLNSFIHQEALAIFRHLLHIYDGRMWYVDGVDFANCITFEIWTWVLRRERLRSHAPTYQINILYIIWFIARSLEDVLQLNIRKKNLGVSKFNDK